ncbi:MAG: hypothetical protein ABIR98_10205 [Usitatibacter sp.]
MNDPEFYTHEELVAIGFEHVGSNVSISRKVSMYAIRGSIGSNVRVDDFTILKGRVVMGSHVHIAAHCLVSGVRGVVELSDFSTLSDSVSIYTGSDDYRADALSSATVPERYLSTISGDVFLGRAALVGSHCVLLPGTVLHEAVSVGALCVINGSYEAGSIVVSAPPRTLIKGKRNVEAILAKANEVLGESG